MFHVKQYGQLYALFRKMFHVKHFPLLSPDFPPAFPSFSHFTDFY